MQKSKKITLINLFNSGIQHPFKYWLNYVKATAEDGAIFACLSLGNQLPWGCQDIWFPRRRPLPGYLSWDSIADWNSHRQWILRNRWVIKSLEDARISGSQKRASPRLVRDCAKAQDAEFSENFSNIVFWRSGPVCSVNTIEDAKTSMFQGFRNSAF